MAITERLRLYFFIDVANEYLKASSRNVRSATESRIPSWPGSLDAPITRCSTPSGVRFASGLKNRFMQVGTAASIASGP